MQACGFGDVRLDRRADIITAQIMATGSLVPRRFGGGRSGELAAGRFLASPKVTPEAILDVHITRTAAAAQGRRIVAIQDTTEINFSGRDRSRKGLGPGADGKSKGFFIHATVAVDADSERLVGVLDPQIWTRPSGGKRKRRQACTVEEKETMRWITAMKCAHLRLVRAATRCIHITDREGDFYPLLARVPDGDGLVIRARHNRKMPAGGKLFEQADAWPDLGVSEIVVPPRSPGDKPRKARVALRASRVRLAKPEARVATPDPDEIEIGLVEVREIAPLPIPRAVRLLRIPDQPALLDDVLAALAALELPDAPAEQQPMLEVRVRLEAPQPGLRARIEEALQGKPVRLAKIETSSATRRSLEEAAVSGAVFARAAAGALAAIADSIDRRAAPPTGKARKRARR